MPENISNSVNNQDVSTETDTDQRDAISREEEEEKKRLAELREQETLILEKNNHNRDDSDNPDLPEEEKAQAQLKREGDTDIVISTDGNTTSIKGDSSMSTALMEDGTIVRYDNDNPDNFITARDTDAGPLSIEYDFTNFDTSNLKDGEFAMAYTADDINKEGSFKVEFFLDKDGAINIESVEGNFEGQINFKNGDKTLTLDKDGQLVEVEEAKELEKDEAKGDGKESKDTDDKDKLDAALDELDLSEIKAMESSSDERSSVPPSTEKNETSRAR